MRTARLLAVILALAALSAHSHAGAQARYNLSAARSVGDKRTEVGDLDLHIAVLASRAGDEAPEVTVGQTVSLRFTEVLLGIGANRKASKLRRYFDKAEAASYLSLRDPVSKPIGLAGRTIVVSRSNGKVNVSSIPGGLSAAARQEAKGWLDDDDMGLLPNREVAIGEEWSLGRSAFGGVVPSAVVTSATAKMKLAEITYHGDYNCARIEVNMDLKARLTGASGVLSINLSGDVFYSLDLKRIVATTLTGPVKATGAISVQGTKANVQGDGEMSVKSEVTWLQVDGKPVTPAK